ncbi:hypothetical protein HY17_19065 [Hyphomonas sp. CY54-11-8]|nr:hypothetical protein HY17_19065 [Hyphomonas sp. CY54-11-8]
MIGTLDYAFAAQHLTYVEMELLGLLPVDGRYTSFCVVRNPYDRALSSIMHFYPAQWANAADEVERHAGFERDLQDWLRKPLKDHNERAHRRPQLDYMRNKFGNIAIDHVLRFESLDADFCEFSRLLGIPETNIKRQGASGRVRSYHDYYSLYSKKLVEAAFGADIETFGYTY